MHAVTLQEFGPAENLTYEKVDDPIPAQGEVRIAVRVVGLHQIETVMRAGLPLGPPLPELPTVFGSEVAGDVDAVGPDVDESWIGRRVVTAHAASGGYAELATAAVDSVHLIPDGVDHQTAVAMVRTGATTLGMLSYAGLSPEDVVLVTSAAGGIGQLLVSRVRAVGGTVVGAAGGPEKTGLVRDLGADLAVDYRQPDWADAIRTGLAGTRRADAEQLDADRPISLVLDGVGGEVAEAAFDLLRPGGRMVLIGASSRNDFTPDPTTLAARAVTVTDALAELLREGDFVEYAEQALRAAAEGSFVPGLHAFGLSQAAEAHRAIENRRTTGKVILEPETH